MADIYTIITNKIIENLEKGIIPWKKPWVGTSGAYNRITKKPYSLMNQLLLSKTGEYATFKQWSDLGGKVKPGAKAEVVCFWKQNAYKKIDEETEEEIIQIIPTLRYYSVFHISDVEGVEPVDTQILDLDSINFVDFEKAENIASSYLEREHINVIISKQDRACYSPFFDRLEMPKKTSFISLNEYYSTLFHESVHSTGYESRLNRSLNHCFGSEYYAKEELVAEIGSAFLCNLCNIDTNDTFTNSSAYIQSWLSALRNDKRLIVSAASKAEKAVNFILTGAISQEVA